MLLCLLNDFFGAGFGFAFATFNVCCLRNLFGDDLLADDIEFADNLLGDDIELAADDFSNGRVDWRPNFLAGGAFGCGELCVLSAEFSLSMPFGGSGTGAGGFTCVSVGLSRNVVISSSWKRLPQAGTNRKSIQN